MSAGPRISASSRAEASAISVRVAKPERRLDQGLNPDRPCPAGLRLGLREQPLDEGDVLGPLDLRDDDAVESLPAAATAASTSSSHHLVETPLTRTLTAAASQLCVRRATATASRASSLRSGGTESSRSTIDLVGDERRPLAELRRRAGWDRETGAAGPHPSRAYGFIYGCAAPSRIGEGAREGSTKRQGRRPALRGFRARPALRRRSGAHPHLGARRSPSGGGRRPAPPTARRPAQRSRDRASERPLAHPNLVCDVAIGQSTGPTQRVLGNLFYRGLVLLRPVFIGDTLRTRTEVVGLKQNRPRPDGTATGLVALRIRTREPAR